MRDTVESALTAGFGITSVQVLPNEARTDVHSAELAEQVLRPCAATGSDGPVISRPPAGRDVASVADVPVGELRAVSVRARLTPGHTSWCW